MSDARPSQIMLPLGDAPTDIASLRYGFERSGLQKLGFTFQWAIKDDLLRRCIANIAEASLRARAGQSRRP